VTPIATRKSFIITLSQSLRQSLPLKLHAFAIISDKLVFQFPSFVSADLKSEKRNVLRLFEKETRENFSDYRVAEERVDSRDLLVGFV
jgi:D-serine dehydratase